MTLAAMANDREAFRDAYRRAIRAAAAMGKPDPTLAVKQSFTTRHPLRSIFKTAPTEMEYGQLLNTMKSIVPFSNGEKDVQDAIRLFNAYGESLGITPYMGKAAPVFKPPTIKRRKRVNPYSIGNDRTNPYF